MKVSLLVLTSVLAFAYSKTLISDDYEDTVKVQVLYETLCPDSIAFITEELSPAFSTLGTKRIDLDLVPYGFATETVVNGTKTFTCQHGPNECYGNKAHACAVDIGTIEQSTYFVICSESAKEPSSSATLEKCAQEVGLTWSDIAQCISSGKGDDLLSENGKKTNAFKPTFIPTIIIDGTYSDENQQLAMDGLKSLVCTLIGYPLPECYC